MRSTFAFVVLATPLFAGQGAMSKAERSFLLDQLEQSKQGVLASIAGLTEARWRFKPASNVWSVAECAEHIILAEELLFEMSQQAMKTAAVPRPESSNAGHDHQIVTMTNDRSHKATAPESLAPSGRFSTPADAVREFTQRRDRILDYARSTHDELRTHATKTPIGTMDAYQVLLAMAAHSARHTAQIREVEANTTFPRTSAKAQFLVVYEMASGTIETLSPQQLATLEQHAAYIRKNVEKGLIVWGGRTNDPKNTRGFALLEVASEKEVREYLAGDPALQAGVLHSTVAPFTEVVRAAK